MSEPADNQNNSAAKMDDEAQKLPQPCESDAKMNDIFSNEVDKVVPQADLDTES